MNVGDSRSIDNSTTIWSRLIQRKPEDTYEGEEGISIRLARKKNEEQFLRRRKGKGQGKKVSSYNLYGSNWRRNH